MLQEIIVLASFAEDHEVCWTTKGKLLGRPKGSKNKKGSVLLPFKDQIKEYLDLKLSLSSIAKIINNQND